MKTVGAAIATGVDDREGVGEIRGEYVESSEGAKEESAISEG